MKSLFVTLISILLAISSVSQNFVDSLYRDAVRIEFGKILNEARIEYYKKKPYRQNFDPTVTWIVTDNLFLNHKEIHDATDRMAKYVEYEGKLTHDVTNENNPYYSKNISYYKSECISGTGVDPDPKVFAQKIFDIFYRSPKHRQCMMIEGQYFTVGFAGTNGSIGQTVVVRVY